MLSVWCQNESNIFKVQSQTKQTSNVSISVNSPKRLSLYKDLIGLTDYSFDNFWAMLFFIFLKVLKESVEPWKIIKSWQKIKKSFVKKLMAWMQVNSIFSKNCKVFDWQWLTYDWACEPFVQFFKFYGKKSESLQTEGRYFRSTICKINDV